MKIIKFVSFNKVHGDIDISVRMIELYCQSIVKLLPVIFKNCINNGIFLDICKKSNIIPVHKMVTNRPLIIIDQFLFYQFMVKCSKKCCSVQYLNFLIIIHFVEGYSFSLNLVIFCQVFHGNYWPPCSFFR